MEKIGVYAAIAAVSKDMSVQGISKDRKNLQGSGYNFRGIDDVLNALAPSLVTNGLVIVPRCLERESVERTTKSGGAIFYTTVKVEFDFIATSDGSKHTAVMYGEAMDTSDKSTNKAMSAAYKYAALQTFCIPTEADNDADASTHEVAPKPSMVSQTDLDVFTSTDFSSLDDLAAAYKSLIKRANANEQHGFAIEFEKVKDLHKASLQKETTE